MDSTKQTAQKVLVKNKLLFVFCILFIMLSLFLVCYLFFFRSITIDLREHMEVTYEGESGSASIRIVNTDHNINQRTQQFLDSISYQATPKTNLSNGSVVQVIANYDETLANKYHIQVINETSEITVEGLIERYANASEIEEEFQTTLDTYAESYFDKNMNEILQNDFTAFYASGNRNLVGKERKYRVFLQAIHHDNKDKIVDIYAITAKGMVNTATDHEDLKEQEATIYYLVTFDDINNAKKLKDENVYGEKIIGIDVTSKEELERILHQKFLLSYQFTIMK